MSSTLCMLSFMLWMQAAWRTLYLQLQSLKTVQKVVHWDKNFSFCRLLVTFPLKRAPAFYISHRVVCLSCSSQQLSSIFVSVSRWIKREVVPIQVLLSVQCRVKQQPTVELPDKEPRCGLRHPLLEGETEQHQKRRDGIKKQVTKSAVKFTISSLWEQSFLACERVNPGGRASPKWTLTVLFPLKGNKSFLFNLPSWTKTPNTTP